MTKIISGKLAKRGKMTASNDFLDNLANDQYQKMLREIANDKIVPKKSDKKVQNDLYEKKEDDDFYEIID